MKKIILSIIAVAALASCQKSEVQEVDGLSAVSFTSGISTRVAGSTWEADDKIGVFMYEVSTTTLYDFYGSNALYYISSGAETTSAKFTSDDPLYFPQEAATNYDFVAYYPYVEGITDGASFTVGSTDQSSEAKLKAQDFMVARAADCSESSSPTLSFDRKMSKVLFKVSRKDSAKDVELTDFTLSNVVSGGTYTISNIASADYTKVTAGTTKESISLFMNESDEVEAIVAPHTATDAKIAVSFSGDTYYGTLSDTFEAGKQYTYTLTVGQNEVELSGATITDWTGVESGDLGTTKISYKASELNADNVPESNTWIIEDETIDDYIGIKAALSAAKTAGREISIMLPNLTSIKKSAFFDCEALVAVDAPNVTKIGDSAFKNCEALVTFDAPNVMEIGDSAFQFASITTFDFEGVESIGESAFASCYSLAEVTNFSITEIPANVFNGAALTTFDFEGVESIGEHAFVNCTSLAEVTNFSITEIPAYAFNNTAFATFDFEGVVSIGEYAFAGCSSLAEVKNLSATTIGASAFVGTGLTSVNITGVKSIGESAFAGCSSLTDVTIVGDNANIGEKAFFECGSLTELSINGVTNIGIRAFTKTGLTSLDLTGVESIEEFAFNSCADLTEVSAPNVTEIGSAVFGECRFLEKVTLGNVVNIGSGTFASCVKLVELYLGDKLETLGNESFAETGLTELTLPASVNSIGSNAFIYGKLGTLRLNWTGEDILTYDSSWFYDTDEPTTIYIPAGTASDYTDKKWSNLTEN